MCCRRGSAAGGEGPTAGRRAEPVHLPPPGEHPAAARVRRGPGLGPWGSRCARAYTSTGLTRCLLRPGSHSAALGGLSAGTCEATSAGSDRPALPPHFLCSLACALCSDCAELTRCFLNDFIEVQRTNASVRICGLVFLSAFSTIRVWNIPRRTPVPSAVARIPPVPPPPPQSPPASNPLCPYRCGRFGHFM